MDRALKVLFEGRWWEFLTRTEAGYDITVTDEIVLREMFVENVYQVGPGDLQDTGIVVDIGGNIGAFDVYCAALGARSIHTYEPESDNWRLLSANIQANGLETTVLPHQLAVAAAAGAAELVQGQAASFVRGVKQLTPQARLMADSAPTESVDAVTLASVFADNEIACCDILKIDCEGSECGIIAATTPEILAKARYITMEFHPAEATVFGRMVAKLTLTHNVHIIGRHNVGGQIYARLY
jgi:FkbM family methyltransferase